jgi:hypothetical protein
MKQPEYTEGTQALENFKSLAAEILQANSKKKKNQAKKPAPSRKSSSGAKARRDF